MTIISFILTIFLSSQFMAWTDQEEEAFYGQLKDGIIQSELRIQKMIQDASSNRYILTPNDEIGLKVAQTSLEVKNTLYNNFYNAPIVQHPQIQDALLKIFNKDVVGIEDLALLKEAVNQARLEEASQ